MRVETAIARQLASATLKEAKPMAGRPARLKVAGYGLSAVTYPRSRVAAVPGRCHPDTRS